MPSRRGFRLRRPTPADAGPLVAMWTRSIRELCRLDHGGRESVLREWCGQKTPAVLAAALADPGMFWVVATRPKDDALLGVGLLGAGGLVHAVYVHPEFARRGVGSALLSALEREARRRGLSVLSLESTATAHPFYRFRGFEDDGPKVLRFGGVAAQPMRKRL
jgi:GNAT superfamily N-acetyltransferase